MKSDRQTEPQRSLADRLLPLIHEFCDAAALSNDIGTVGNLIIDLAVNYTGAERGSLMLLDESNRLSILASRGIELHLHDGPPIRLGEGVAGLVALNGSPVLVKDITKDALFSPMQRDRYRTASFVSCPVASKHKLLGVISVSDKKDAETFSDDDFEIVKLIADQGAVILENALLVDKLRSRAAELQDMNRKLIAGDQSKSEFLARVSHELRTPLNSMKGAIHYLQLSGNVPPKKKRLFHSIISQETTKLVQTVEGLLDFLRVEEKSKIIEKGILFLPDVLRDAAESRNLKSLLASRGVSVTIECGKRVSTIVGDKLRATQAIANLTEALCHSLCEGECLLISVSENASVAVRFALPGRIPEAMRRQLSLTQFDLKGDEPEALKKLHFALKAVESHQWNLQTEETDKGSAVILKIPKKRDLTVEAVTASALERFVEIVSEVLDLRSCSIMIMDSATGDLTIGSAKGLDEEIVRETRVKHGEPIAGWVASNGWPMLVKDIEQDTRFNRPNLSRYNTKSFISIPLKADDKVHGVINLNNKRDGLSFTESDLTIAAMLAERISHFLGNLDSGRYDDVDLRKFMASLDRLLRAWRRYAKKCSPHRELLIPLLDRLGATDEEKSAALYISTIYDLGLAHVRNLVLSKKDLLPSEQRALRLHPYSTISILGMFEFSDLVKRAILHHHENWDGTGYPDGLKSDEIPFLSRVMAVLDSFCAMTSERPYRAALPPGDALDELRRCGGSRYDPRVVEAFHDTMTARSKGPWTPSTPAGHA